MSNINEAIDSIFTAIFSKVESSDADSDNAFEILSIAASTGDREFFRQLVAAEKAKNRKENDPTVLYGAVSAGKEDIVRALIEAGVDVNAQFKMFFTFNALLEAINKGFSNIVKMLLDAGADPNLHDGGMMSCLAQAVKKGQTDIVNLLLEHGAIVKTGTGFRLLVKAAEESTPEIVQILFEAGCNINTRDNQDATPLTTACMRANVEMVRTLIDLGANVDKNGMHGYTPLISVLYAEKLMGMLSHHGLSEKFADTEERVLAIAQMLIEAGADVNCRDAHHGTTALMLAIQRHYFKVAKFLVIAKVDINAISNPDPKSIFVGKCKNVTALHLAVEENLIEFVQLLLNAEANPNILDSDNLSPLDVAIAKEFSDIQKLLTPAQVSLSQS